MSVTGKLQRTYSVAFPEVINSSDDELDVSPKKCDIKPIEDDIPAKQPIVEDTPTQLDVKSTELEEILDAAPVAETKPETVPEDTAP